MHVMNRSVSIYRLKVLSHSIQTLSRPQYAIFCGIIVVSNAYNEKSWKTDFPAILTTQYCFSFMQDREY